MIRQLLVIIGPLLPVSRVWPCWLKNLTVEIVSPTRARFIKGSIFGTAKVTRKEMMGVPHYLLMLPRPELILPLPNTETGFKSDK